MTIERRSQDGMARTGDGLLLPGLDGANPLGFLAALGLFRVLSKDSSLASLHMRWIPFGGTWIPALNALPSVTIDQESLLCALDDRLAKDIAEHPVHLIETLGEAGNDPGKRGGSFLRRPPLRNGQGSNGWHASQRFCLRRCDQPTPDHASRLLLRQSNLGD